MQTLEVAPSRNPQCAHEREAEGDLVLEQVT